MEPFFVLGLGDCGDGDFTGVVVGRACIFRAVARVDRDERHETDRPAIGREKDLLLMKD